VADVIARNNTAVPANKSVSHMVRLYRQHSVQRIRTPAGMKGKRQRDYIRLNQYSAREKEKL
jgi:hypothetical protein